MKNTMIYEPVMACTEENYCQTWKTALEVNEAHMQAIEQKAIESGDILYRFLYESVADGKAIYQIVKVNKRTVKVRLCSLDGLYCDYVVPQWGTEATIPIDYAKYRINWQDTWRAMSAKS
jgi:hypothetical protein